MIIKNDITKKVNAIFPNILLLFLFAWKANRMIQSKINPPKNDTIAALPVLNNNVRSITIRPVTANAWQRSLDLSKKRNLNSFFSFSANKAYMAKYKLKSRYVARKELFPIKEPDFASGRPDIPILSIQKDNAPIVAPAMEKNMKFSKFSFLKTEVMETKRAKR